MGSKKKLTRNQWIAIIVGGLTIIGALIAGSIYITLNAVKNSNFNQSPVCVGDNCQQNINYEEEKEIYVTPEKKLIRANMADYSFPLKIINERDEDYNDIGLVFVLPGDFGSTMPPIMIEPKDRSEIISKYNNTMQLSLPYVGVQNGDIYPFVCFIESVYKKEIKEYKVTINTRGYDKDFYIEFGLINISKNPELVNIFRSFGAE